LLDIGRIHRHPYSPSPPGWSHEGKGKSIGKYDRREAILQAKQRRAMSDNIEGKAE